MKTIKLKTLQIENFKGIQSKEIHFGKQTEIRGRNKAGKSSIFDAFTWLLYGKNSQDQKDFSIKTLDQNNKPIHNLDHSVTGTFEIDGVETVLKRLYREKWTTKRGSDNPELTGHESTFWVDGVPKSSAEFSAFVSSILHESVSKMVTSATYFNEKLKWNERREILTQMAGRVDELEFAKNGNLNRVIQMLESGRSVEDQKKVNASQKKVLKDEFDLIPARIDELHKLVAADVDWGAIEKQLSDAESELQSLNLQINDESLSIKEKNEKRNEAIRAKMALENELSKLSDVLISESNRERDKLQTSLQDLKGRICDILSASDSCTVRIENRERVIKENKEKIESLRNKWREINAENFEFNEKEVSCPTCKRAYDDSLDRVDSLRSEFNRSKVARLEDNVKQGKWLKEEIELAEKNIQEIKDSQIEISDKAKALEKSIESVKAELDKPVEIPKPTAEMIELQNKIANFEIPEAVTAPSNEELSAKRLELSEKIKELQKELYQREQQDKTEARIQELIKKQKELSEQINAIDAIDFEIEQFNKLLIDEVERRVNEKFAIVKFKMFEDQINGGQAPTCECMIDGVPYNDVNTAGKIQAGVDVINALQYHYSILAPVFIDNRESVTSIPQLDCQTVSLIVDPSAQEIEVLIIEK